jgi:hypothetical protein
LDVGDDGYWPFADELIAARHGGFPGEAVTGTRTLMAECDRK